MDEDECLQRITELVYDDNEIVTATSLSKILKINIHNAQSLLDKYVKNADVPGQTDLSWTFTIIGTGIDAGLSISIAKQDEVENVKSKLQTVLAEHAFSVQRKGNVDLVILANVEPFTEDKVRTEPLQGSIVSKNAVRRKLRKNPININEVKQDVNKVETKQIASIDVSKPKKNGIEGFFSKGSTVPSAQPKPVFTPKVKQNNMFTNFFTKSNSFNKTQIINKETENEEYVNGNACSNETIKEIKMDVDDEPPSKTMEIYLDENDKNSKDKEDIKQAKRSKKRKSQHKGHQAVKKRKRILETADSDSDIFASSESEEEVLSDAHYSDENHEEEIKPEPIVPTKARQMKQVTEEFFDDEGFLNTVQKYIFVSEDEDEENKQDSNINITSDKPIVETKNPSTCEIKKEISLRKPNKNKDKTTKTIQNQQSIMNFFKKT